MSEALDQLALFEKLRKELLPQVMEDLAAGKTDKEILEKYRHYAAGRLVTTVALEPDAAKATAAAKEILDRTTGKPVEKREVKHRYAELPDEQLDAALATKLKAVSGESEE